MKETKTTFSYLIEHMESPSFQKVRNLSYDFVSKLPSELRDELHDELNRGIEILDSEPLLQMYLYSFGLMHAAKLNYAFEKAKDYILRYENEIEIIDYGCGQGLATMCYHDFIKSAGNNQQVKRITLIEPSALALSRAELVCSKFFPEAEIIAVNKCFDDISPYDIVSSESIPTVHLFSNILDVEAYEINNLIRIVNSISKGSNEFVIVSPIQNSRRLGRLKSFAAGIGQHVYHEEYLDKYNLDKEKEWTCSLLLCTSNLIQKGIFLDFEEIFQQAKEVLYCKDSEFSHSQDVYFKLQIAAQCGDKQCQNALGVFYKRGCVVEKDYTKAFEWFKKSAEQKYIPAICNLASCYKSGKGVDVDVPRAVKLYEEGVSQGHSAAQFELGMLYLKGRLVPKEVSKAIGLLTLSANQGLPSSLRCLGNIYYKGIHVPKDYEKAIEYLTEAGEKNDKKAIKMLINIFDKRCGMEFFKNKQYDLFVKAVELGIEEVSVVTIRKIQEAKSNYRI